MKYFTILIPGFLCLQLNAQFPDSSRHTDPVLKNEIISDLHYTIQEKKEIKSLVLPAFLITYGFVSLDNDPLLGLDKSIRNEIREDHPYFHTQIDNYTQHVPGAAVFGLRALGIKGKNNFRDQAVIYFLSNTFMAITVQSLKALTRVQRPDGHGTNAFPSGHTATAFVGAEFLNQEYKDRSIWYSIAGYTVATGTGILRMYNNRHWLRDVIAGAGFGMLTTKLVYWAYPSIKRKVFKEKSTSPLLY